MSEVWTRWQGHLINGVFPLGRYLGCSDHSGVFLTQSPARGAELAIKLVPTNRTLAEAQLPRWKRAGALAHPHLLRLLEWGGCQLDGLPYLYTVMEYADQTLAQLLLSRALTVDEVQEMLLPTLDALAFLHTRGLVQGQLKPTNILVVGDQLKLASDTIRRVSDGTMSNQAATVYDAPEERHGGSSSAGDVWALGVSLYEALTRHKPSVPGDPGKAVVLPGDFPEPLRAMVGSCLSPSPHDRPSVTDLMVSAGAHVPESIPAAPVVVPVTAEPMAAEPEAGEPVAPVTVLTREPSTIEPSAGEPIAPKPTALTVATPAVAAAKTPPTGAPVRVSLRPRALQAALVAVALTVAILWIGVRAFRAHHTPAASPVEALQGAPSQTPDTATPAEAQARTPVTAVPGGKIARGEAGTASSAVHEVIPDVPRSARRTVRGHIDVWVRVIIDQNGSVIAASADRNGPSRYFQRLAIDSAKQWTFPPADTPSHRLMQIRFDFSHDGTTAHAVPVH
jgi:hypothetical protein